MYYRPGGRGSSSYRGSRGNSSSSYRGGRGGWWQPQVVVPATPAPPLGAMIKQLNADDLVEETSLDSTYKHDARITDSVLVASFNWRDGKTPTIVVPGRPARWTPLAEPREIPDDNGNMGSRNSRSTREVFRDQNSGRFPRHPMQPAIVATLKMAPTLPHGDDRPEIVACGSTIGSLLRFVSGNDKPFRMLVEAVGDTVFLVRRENSPGELIPNIQGFGHSFPEHYTTWDQDVKGSLSHQRVMRYRFGGLRLLVRFEGDGYLAQAGRKVPSDRRTPPSNAVDDLLGSLERTAVSQTETSTGAELEVQSSGELIDQSVVFDLKTRSIKKIDQDTLGEELPRLWVKQMGNFILAYHERGVFNKVDVIPTVDKVKKWEAENQKTLAKLAALLHRIRSLSLNSDDLPDGKFEVCFSGSGALEFRKQLPDAGDALSEEMKAAWGTGREGAGPDSPDEFEEDDDDGDYYKPVGVGRKPIWLGGFDDDEVGDDFTACSAELCGYCGRCSY
ncbi:hypothetical protein MAPG_11388 [Magnaporthiopsis poae ATCC 64411]|uniref:Geranylgeranyl pyrophosphate synthetase n=1 Tax=Magnaporthiopsis poae (strain ATCC 64411 / 73-15) TaxID=644358 RepID=A0A0C4EF54_MAGP6|nr:hypothetical protein MAPG_11388 [Magnaporthiopsis poae ATCC 64411]